jgi:hypothetical protein
MGCNRCGDHSGSCGCDNGRACGSGLLGGRGLFGGDGRSMNCPDCENGWGANGNGSGPGGCGDGCGIGSGNGGDMNGGVALVGGMAGANGGAAMGCGLNGCGIGGNLCPNCRARAMSVLRGHSLARNPYGMIPHTPSSQMQGQGPVTPTYVYPYYTTRGPRDFLNPNPPSIGY